MQFTNEDMQVLGNVYVEILNNEGYVSEETFDELFNLMRKVSEQ